MFAVSEMFSLAPSRQPRNYATDRTMKLNLNPFMRAANMNLTELATSVGIGKGYASDIRSGKKTPSPEVIAKIAAALGVEPGAIIDSPPPDGLQKPAADFFMADAVAKPLRNNIASLIATITPDARKAAMWKSVRSAPAFGILVGDVLIVDLGAGPLAGDLVICTPEDYYSITLLRRWAGPYLLSDTSGQPTISSTRGIAILGVVRGVLRGSGL